MPKIEEQSREAIAKLLPGAVKRALESYKMLLLDHATTNNPDAKDYKAHHDACKVAIAHIELLIKLARWADLPDPQLKDKAKQRELQTILENGNKVLGREE